MKGADHHLRRIDQAVMQSRNLARPESAGPMRFFQLPPQARLAVGDPGEGEEAVLEETKQQRTILPVCARFPPGVEDLLNFLDDFRAAGQEGSEKVEMRLKPARHLLVAGAGHVFNDGSRVRRPSHTSS